MVFRFASTLCATDLTLLIAEHPPSPRPPIVTATATTPAVRRGRRDRTARSICRLPLCAVPLDGVSVYGVTVWPFDAGTRTRDPDVLIAENTTSATQRQRRADEFQPSRSSVPRWLRLGRARRIAWSSTGTPPGCRLMYPRSRYSRDCRWPLDDADSRCDCATPQLNSSI